MFKMRDYLSSLSVDEKNKIVHTLASKLQETLSNKDTIDLLTIMLQYPIEKVSGDSVDDFSINIRGVIRNC